MNQPEPQPLRPILDIRQTIAVAIGLGVVAALVVWWLRRFEYEHFHNEWREFLQNHAAFEEWLEQRGRNDG